MYLNVTGRYYLRNAPASEASEDAYFKHHRFWLRVEEHWERKEEKSSEAALALGDKERDGDEAAAQQRSNVVAERVKAIVGDIKALAEKAPAKAPAKAPDVALPPKRSHAGALLDAAVAASAAVYGDGAASAAAKRSSQRRGSTSGR